MLSELPTEVLLQIFGFLINETSRSVISLLLVNSSIKDLCQSILHTNLRFKSLEQMNKFNDHYTRVTYRPRTLDILLAGGAVDPQYRLFKVMHQLLSRITETDLDYLTDINLCMNSHTFDHNSIYLFKGLSLVNPEVFTWRGPDPAHHFSTAIVPRAANYLTLAIYTWSNLRHLKLTNISLSTEDDADFVLDSDSEDTQSMRGTHLIADTLLRSTHIKERLESVASSEEMGALAKRHSSWGTARALSYLTNLSSIYLGQVTFLDPLEIARIACAESELPSLNSIRIVDAYRGSIWGPRVRKSDVEIAVITLHHSQQGSHMDRERESEFIVENREARLNDFSHAYMKNLERVRTLVSCEALTERIMGGDRMDELGL